MTPRPSAFKAGNCRQKRFAGKMYAEEYVSLSWSPAVYGRGKYWSQCAARGSGQGYPPRPWNSPPPVGQGRSLLPSKLELPTSHKKNPFLMIVLLLRISYCTQGIVYCLLECLVVLNQLLLFGHGERHDGNDPPFSCLEDLFAGVLNVHIGHMHGKCISDMQSSLIRQLGFSYW